MNISLLSHFLLYSDSCGREHLTLDRNDNLFRKTYVLYPESTDNVHWLMRIDSSVWFMGVIQAK